jgi:hypothetical protein
MARPLANETVGIPNDWIFDILMGDERTNALAKAYAVRLHLPSTAADALVTLARATDTPDAFDMGLTWHRTLVATEKIKWRLQPDFEAQLQAMARAHRVAARDLEMLAASIMWKRERNVTPNAAAPGQQVLFFISIPEQTGHWLDVTASNDPPRQRVAQRVPRPRPGRFWLNVPADATNPARYAQACRSCCNRVPLPSTAHYQKCSTCEVARYCSRDCQTRDWPVHKGAECAKLKALRPAEPEQELEKKEEETGGAEE